MQSAALFNILDSVDSTNNYAMAKLHEGLASHGMAWFAREQTAGKGQRGKQWHSEPGDNILLSIICKPAKAFISNPFFLSALIATTCNEFLQKITGESFYIKWPNDLYWRDRKTGGILIENKYQGDNWNWAVIGIGINVNQTMFASDLKKPVSIKEVSGKEQFDPQRLASELHEYILEKINTAEESDFTEILEKYNLFLYKKDETVKLKKDSATFSTNIQSVNAYGQLLTSDSTNRTFDFGEVEWIFTDLD
ncbi:MAG: biotin--[acetyl-CoA-carboxylase] ligase [Chitinophagaceae bacterium]|nr:MAG: biotin--[acetyl-CoA-carboxylase] ligase [Chitinophagaceae bacterium]